MIEWCSVFQLAIQACLGTIGEGDRGGMLECHWQG